MRYVFIILICSAVITFSLSRYNKRAEIVFFDVGQGDSYALRTNNNKIILVDGGPDWKTLNGLGRWLNFFEREIEIIILTHTHADHISALPEILKRYKVKRIYLPSHLSGAESIALLDALGDGVDIVYPNKNLCIDFSSDCSLCIFPPSAKFKQSKDENDLSLATQFNCSGLTMFGAGDASSEREGDITESDLFSQSDILKVSHHGSVFSTDSSLLGILNPKIAIISVGKENGYGHPGIEVINRLNHYGVDVWRTDLNQSIIFFSNNKRKIFRKSFP